MSSIDKINKEKIKNLRLELNKYDSCKFEYSYNKKGEILINFKEKKISSEKASYEVKNNEKHIFFKNFK
jgi:hypothetical protein